jgi:hypothetical protein
MTQITEFLIGLEKLAKECNVELMEHPDNAGAILWPQYDDDGHLRPWLGLYIKPSHTQKCLESMKKPPHVHSWGDADKLGYMHCVCKAVQFTFPTQETQQ